MASLKLLPPENGNTPDKEVIRIRVLADTLLSLYAVIDKTFGPKGETDKFRHIYRFPGRSVKKGDWIRLYSGKGDNKQTKTKDGETVHHFYWGSDSCIWNDKGDTAYLIRYSVIESIDLPAV